MLGAGENVLFYFQHAPPDLFLKKWPGRDEGGVGGSSRGTGMGLGCSKIRLVCCHLLVYLNCSPKQGMQGTKDLEWDVTSMLMTPTLSLLAILHW